MYKTCARPSQTKYQLREKMGTPSPIPNWVTMGNFWLLGGGESFFPMNVVTGKSPMLQGKVTYPRISRQHKFVFMGVREEHQVGWVWKTGRPGKHWGREVDMIQTCMKLPNKMVLKRIFAYVFILFVVVYKWLLFVSWKIFQSEHNSGETLTRTWILHYSLH